MTSINSETKKFGIIGYPISHTFSPAMHNAAFSADGFNGIYLVFPMKNLISLKFSMRQLKIEGLSVTIPHKIHVLRILDAIDPAAVQIGSVNTLVWENNILKGYNTDAYGAVHSLKENGVSLAGKKVLIAGSGGSARSIAFGVFRENPAQITLAARNRIKAKKIIHNLADIVHKIRLGIMSLPEKGKIGEGEIATREKKNYRGIFYCSYVMPEQIHEFDIIIHTTPMGMKNHPLADVAFFSAENFRKGQVLFDIVYNPMVTPLVREARKSGAEIVPGYKMLLHQGARQYELFTKRTAPITVMENALLKEMNEI